MKEIMVYAYTAHNLGDDLFIHILCKRYPETTFYLYAPKRYEQTFVHLKNLKVIPSDTFFNRVVHRFLNQFSKRKKIAKQCDASIYIGGSLFIQNPNWQKEVQKVQSMNIQEKPFFILGANFGPFSDKKFLDTYEQVFSRCADVCFRDNASFDLFHHLPNVRKAADIVFQLQTNHTVSKNNSKTIVISVIYPSVRRNLHDEDTTYFEAMKNIVIACINNDYAVTLMGFCNIEKDHLAIDKILSLLPKQYKNKVRTYCYETNIEKAIEEISSAKAIIATRFHAMILGWVYEKPVYPILYSSKMKSVIDDGKFNIAYRSIKHLQQLSPEAVLNALNVQPIDISEQKINAVQQFLKLDEFLQK